MHDIRFIREHPDLLRMDLAKRGDKEKSRWIDEILALDKEYRALLQKTETLRQRRNTLSKEINEMKKSGKDSSSLLSEAKEIPEQLKAADEKSCLLQARIRDMQMRLPNILHESVPVGTGEEGNVAVKECGKRKNFAFPLLGHGELLEKKGQVNFQKAADVSGSGFYYLLDKAALLDFALQKYALDILMKKGFIIVEPPLMIRKGSYEGVTDLADFENVMYKIQDDDLYLIATSEHAIGVMHSGECFSKSDLPRKYAGISPCFRREIGSHGVDNRGLFRVHQFNKIEQFVFSTPDESWKIHEELLANAEEIFASLELPYRVISICTGDIGTVAAKKYDIEVWMPREKKYREVVSCSNCTAYQATRLNIKYQKDTSKEYVHTLNSTAIATSRVIRAIAENFQEANGTIIIPKVLHPYMNGIQKI